MKRIVWFLAFLIVGYFTAYNVSAGITNPGACFPANAMSVDWMIAGSLGTICLLTKVFQK